VSFPNPSTNLFLAPPQPVTDRRSAWASPGFNHTPAIGDVFWSGIGVITNLLNIDADLIGAGRHEFHFRKRM